MKRHGWDYHYGYYDHVDCHGFYTPYLFENGNMITIDGNTRMDHGKADDGESDEKRAARWDRSGRRVFPDLFDDKIQWFRTTS